MNDDDDDTLAGIDLSAWEPPPPPGGIADAVVTRMRAPVRASALEPNERGSRRWWMIGALAAAVAAAAVLVAWGVTRAPASGRGELAAARPEHLELGPTSAELDPGADVRWDRSGHRVHVVQPTGRALWRVGGDDTLVIDAGAMVASVEATGASLRVEVHMNLTEARILGASAVTAAAVAMVTVVVYEGHVKVRSAGQTVNVAPGATVEVRPDQPPSEVLTVGGGDEVARALAEAAAARAKVEELEQRIEELGAGSARTTCDEVACVLNNYEGDCCLRFKPLDRQSPTPPSSSLPESLDRAAISSGIAGIKADVRACDDGSYVGTLKLSVKVASDGHVTNVIVKDGAPKPGACAATAMRKARFPATRNGGSFAYPFSFGKCDADQLEAAGKASYAAGSFDDAYAAFAAAYQCKAEPATAQKAFLAGCNLRDVAKARRFFQHLDAAMRARTVQVCIRNGITQDDLEETPCDSDAHKEKGQQAFAAGNYQVALSGFESAYQCKPEALVAQKAFIAACNLRNLGKAKRWFQAMPAAMQHQTVSVCVRNGISEDELRATGKLQLTSTPPAEVFIGARRIGATPVEIELAAGQHELELVAGGKTHRFSVAVKAGETVTVRKDLTNP